MREWMKKVSHQLIAKWAFQFIQQDMDDLSLIAIHQSKGISWAERAIEFMRASFIWWWQMIMNEEDDDESVVILILIWNVIQIESIWMSSSSISTVLFFSLAKAIVPYVPTSPIGLIYFLTSPIALMYVPPSITFFCSAGGIFDASGNRGEKNL